MPCWPAATEPGESSRQWAFSDGVHKGVHLLGGGWIDPVNDAFTLLLDACDFAPGSSPMCTTSKPFSDRTWATAADTPQSSSVTRIRPVRLNGAS